MIIYKLAIAIFIFSSMVGVYNDLGIFEARAYEPGLHNISESDIEEIYKPDTSGEVESGGLINDIMGIPGFLYKLLGLAWTLLANAFSLGSIFSQYVPGVVGERIGLIITAVTYFVYAWGGIQLWQKVSSKQMD